MAEKVTREEMAKILAENRHKAILSALKNMQQSIESTRNETKPTATVPTDEIVRKISSEISKTMASLSPTVNVNQQDVVQAISQLGESIKKALEQNTGKGIEKPESPKQWEFEIIRDNFNRILTVKATAKP